MLSRCGLVFGQELELLLQLDTQVSGAKKATILDVDCGSESNRLAWEHKLKHQTERKFFLSCERQSVNALHDRTASFSSWLTILPCRAIVSIYFINYVCYPLIHRNFSSVAGFGCPKSAWLRQNSSSLEAWLAWHPTGSRVVNLASAS
ncbi:hypothetical protein EUGRSUZ_D00564 [Eucalyptus grandis]|uniref:Uncharacterized protein n=2 Tax=Eucalyptus grandis TaxID=71139 RepID=A0ACC3L2M0_EUCGR|nr:hypothetical protein EUGRSUZ_D00564 [Eucalyptus grandis]